MVDWNQWRTLLAVFRHGTYAGAAKSLKIDATTVGRRLGLLEKRLGYGLFHRGKDDQLYPTRRCETLLTHIEAAAESLRNAEQESVPAESGAVWRELRMTAPPFLVTNLFAPAIDRLAGNLRIRVELLGTVSNLGLPRREVDIAIRIEDRPKDLAVDAGRIATEQIGTLRYAVYAARGLETKGLPWAGLIEQYVHSAGGKVMMDLARPGGFQFQAYHFDSLREIVAAGVARSLLPVFMGDLDTRLTRSSEVMLEQPLWMLYHRQDSGIVHLRTARDWISSLAETLLPRT